MRKQYYIKQIFIMTVLKKAIFYSVEIYRKIKKNNLAKRRLRRRNDWNSCSWGFKKKDYYAVHVIELFLYQRT